MKNYVQDGEVITVAAPAIVASGDPVAVGTLFGVAQTDAASGADVALVTRGVFDLDTVTNAPMAIGDALYFDATTSLVTKATTGNAKIGAALAAKTTTGTTVRVRLNGVF
ncbi:DUF2190 family protein [Methylobrevis pamukkalensis]|uniref:DUF2190 family protein n=1 Tax=Methylobrevis pamukkalensis TaxID=1439726 RepID=A0A1E3GZP1_9HYPH|nr:DUF2190 family protein [Methylobrevis pamukkalensis]ODN69548.1 hypothetical protein A6302_03142 [Methylobrevis pamukkalensis]